MRLRRKLITAKTDATLADALDALRNLAVGEGDSNQRPLGKLRDDAPQQVAAKLRAKNERLYSADVLGRLLNVSKATAHRWATAKAVVHG